MAELGPLLPGQSVVAAPPRVCGGLSRARRQRLLVGLAAGYPRTSSRAAGWWFWFVQCWRPWRVACWALGRLLAWCMYRGDRLLFARAEKTAGRPDWATECFTAWVW